MGIRCAWLEDDCTKSLKDFYTVQGIANKLSESWTQRIMLSRLSKKHNILNEEYSG